MDNLTNRLIARTHLENFEKYAPQASKAEINDILMRWDDLSRLEGFDEFVSAISTVAQTMNVHSTSERGSPQAVAAAMASSCLSFLLRESSHKSITVEPRPAGGGKTGIRRKM